MGSNPTRWLYYLQSYYLHFFPVILSLRDGTEFHIRSGDYQSVANPEILSTMAGEIFEIYMYEKARNALKLPTMVGEIFETYMYEMARNAFKLSTMV